MQTAADAADTDPVGLGQIDAAVPSPPITAAWLGVENLPQNLLGNAANGQPLHWALPRQGFTVDLHAQAPSQPGAPIDLAAYPADGAAPIALAAAANWLADGKQAWVAHIAVPPDELKPGEWQLAFKYAGDATATLQLTVAQRSPDIDPFDLEDNWLLVFSRDLNGLQVAKVADEVTVTTTDGANGVADFDESLAAFGLLGGDKTFNQKMRQLFLERFRRWMRLFFLLDPQTGQITDQSVRIRIFLEGDDLGGLAPAEVSKMAVGGLAPQLPDKKQLFGLATIDLWNAHSNDDAVPGLGVFTYSMVKAALAQPVAVALLQGVLPALGGQPFGSVKGDDALLDPQLENQKLPEDPKYDRARLFLLEMRLLSMAIASVTAHEMGHSLGMIHPGLPPHGLLGGVPGPWVVKPQDEHHIDTVGPNLMQTGDSFDPAELLGNTPAFSPLELGYLRRKLLILK